MSKESYIRGFCKAADASGVDPVALAKYAQSIVNGGGPVASFINGPKNVVSNDFAQKIISPVESTPKRIGKAIGKGIGGFVNSALPAPFKAMSSVGGHMIRDQMKKKINSVLNQKK